MQNKPVAKKSKSATKGDVRAQKLTKFPGLRSGLLRYRKNQVQTGAVRFSGLRLPYKRVLRVTCSCVSASFGCSREKFVEIFFKRKHISADHSDEKEHPTRTAFSKSGPTTLKAVLLFDDNAHVDECVADEVFHAKDAVEHELLRWVCGAGSD